MGRCELGRLWQVELARAAICQTCSLLSSAQCMGVLLCDAERLSFVTEAHPSLLFFLMGVRQSH